MTYDKNTPSAILVGITDSGEKLCAASGRISTQPGDAMEILLKSEDPAKNSSLIQKVTKSGHNSTVEHAFFNIAFNNVSIMTEQFMIEYRLASFTVKSRRYVDFGNAGFYTPAFDRVGARERYEEHIRGLLSTYRTLTQAGVPKEDARFVLPYCVYSNFYCSLNARELLHVIRGMLWGRGSRFEELHMLGEQLLEQAKSAAPGIFGSFEQNRCAKVDSVNFFSYRTREQNTKKGEPVELLNAPEKAHLLLAKTALISGTQLSTEEIDRLLEDKATVQEVISAVLASSRPRALEALNYTFRLNHVSLAEVTHIARHRIQSPLFASLTCVCREDHVLPPSIAQNSEYRALFEKAFEKNAKLYHQLQGEGVAEEQLVYLVLSGNTMDVVTTINARELLLFFKLRTCRRAQWEIQAHAGEMLRLLRRSAPLVFNHFGPSCYVEGSCPEGRLTCGNFALVKEEFTPKP